jgi:hypothetical protein
LLIVVGDYGRMPPRADGPEAKITASEIRDLKADRLKRLDD